MDLVLSDTESLKINTRGEVNIRRECKFKGQHLDKIFTKYVAHQIHMDRKSKKRVINYIL